MRVGVQDVVGPGQDQRRRQTFHRCRQRIDARVVRRKRTGPLFPRGPRAADGQQKIPPGDFRLGRVADGQIAPGREKHHRGRHLAAPGVQALAERQRQPAAGGIAGNDQPFRADAADEVVVNALDQGIGGLVVVLRHQRIKRDRHVGGKPVGKGRDDGPVLRQQMKLEPAAVKIKDVQIAATALLAKAEHPAAVHILLVKAEPAADRGGRHRLARLSVRRNRREPPLGRRGLAGAVKQRQDDGDQRLGLKAAPRTSRRQRHQRGGKDAARHHAARNDDKHERDVLHEGKLTRPRPSVASPHRECGGTRDCAAGAPWTSFIRRSVRGHARSSPTSRTPRR